MTEMPAPPTHICISGGNNRRKCNMVGKISFDGCAKLKDSATTSALLDIAANFRLLSGIPEPILIVNAPSSAKQPQLSKDPVNGIHLEEAHTK